jgi:WD40 repeat protein
LIGVWSTNLLEISDVDGSLIEFNALSTHSLKECEVATAGADKTICLWNTVDHALTIIASMKNPISCISYSHDGEKLAVGIGTLSLKNID